MNAKAREAEIGAGFRRRGLAEGEILRPIGDFSLLAVRDLVDVDPVLVEEAAMEELQFERQLLAVPARVVGQEADRAVAVVIEILKSFGKLLVGGLVGLAGEIPRHLANDGAIECRGLRLRG